ncbi:glycosyltransferase family 2 protein [Nocardioides sp. CER19]|uniref:glycosyltransferase family 2 protein n=1 Tax=Nocardioides sp. CER19 TaxID=3038538 RepID=UPI00244B9ECE|nr:glycosyltransferase family 2 protein [Nocardioides sp. CER19]MDH2415106.1 glycosyltransferase family 2 protein [Nocardioides sp. CER19]
MSGLDTSSLVPHDGSSTNEAVAGRGASASERIETVAIVVVTYNRADLLVNLLDGLARLERPADAVIVVDNASTDHTAAVLEASGLPGLRVIRTEKNLGGAGGFHAGMKAAHEAGFDRIWLMDDDVVPAPDCLTVLMGLDENCLMSVRENTDGSLIELAATRFDLANPLAVKPKTASVMSSYGDRARMPERVQLENVAFEGFMVRRRVVDTIGLPDPSYFIFYDDVDYALRARRAGFRIWAIRDARLVRQLDFSQQHDLSSWKGFFMYRNLFVVHLRYGENALVRAKPWAITVAVTVLSLLRGRRGEASNVIRALRSARGMRSLPPSSVD